MKNYVLIQVIAGIYLMIFVAALYFATGVQTGFKLDDNQLIGYGGCGILLVSLVASLFTVKIKLQKGMAVLLTLCCVGLLFNGVNFNEAFWYFILFVVLIPFWMLLETVIFVTQRE
ncbi:hypothetical protein [Lactiplantibacillus xiangfangensis]|uniref:Integral membrane protein n=1 Tax=Lactiplantibacillus xiangfangensis TaxID=942150 RepID=A0A0R2MAY0_9LACO|nr:hypothetical protein [Lactiplantibacillus xiangfangensis]KRO08371.1 hypothetical protein IV64_GL000454 [Lactiplantibacillus xiangfangensis]